MERRTSRPHRLVVEDENAPQEPIVTPALIEHLETVFPKEPETNMDGWTLDGVVGLGLRVAEHSGRMVVLRYLRSLVKNPEESEA